MLSKIADLGKSQSRTSGRVSFFGILMAVVLVIAIVILFMVGSEVFKKEKINLTIQVKDDAGSPVTGAAIYIDNELIAHTTVGGVYIHTYTSDQQGQRHQVKAENADFEPYETSVTLGPKPATVALTLRRTIASVTILATDSTTGLPLAGVDIQMGGANVGSTDLAGRLVLSSFHLHDSPTFMLNKKLYQTKTQYYYISSKDTLLTIALSKGQSVAPPVIKVESPTAYAFIKREIKKTAPPPIQQHQTGQDITSGKPEDDADLVVDTTMPPEVSSEADSAYLYMTGGNYRRALEIYSSLTAQRRWLARPDYWLYGADCALHLASDANGSYSETVIDSALKSLDEAERNQNIVEQDYFPALVHLKKGEAWAYKCKMQSGGSAARHEEYRQKALFYLRSAITQMNNLQYTDSDIYRFALRMRDEVQNR
ncbi:MAG TPA: hypothetical protein DEO84_11315 [candidate division Zixibacteria bacterium]|nr:hypothetical protein [candidate division Zixibacteria bacterium]